MVKWVALFILVVFVASKFLNTSPALAWKALPLLFQVALAFFFIAFQFIGLFWFLSRGGIDVYYPDDIKTRFTDVWGQDHVLERVKENIIYLEDPERIET